MRGHWRGLCLHRKRGWLVQGSSHYTYTSLYYCYVHIQWNLCAGITRAGILQPPAYFTPYYWPTSKCSMEIPLYRDMFFVLPSTWGLPCWRTTGIWDCGHSYFYQSDSGGQLSASLLHCHCKAPPSRRASLYVSERWSQWVGGLGWSPLLWVQVMIYGGMWMVGSDMNILIVFM